MRTRPSYLVFFVLIVSWIDGSHSYARVRLSSGSKKIISGGPAGVSGVLGSKRSIVRNELTFRGSKGHVIGATSFSLEGEERKGPVLGKAFSGIVSNVKKRWPHYKSDWTDGLNQKSLSAILFLFFTCLAPVVAFGGLTNIITDGTIGVIEFILSCGISGMVYSLLCGQPMTFLGPTGLTLAFITALYNFTRSRGYAFLPLYSWTGIWTSVILTVLSIFNASNLISFCTTFTDDVFNALLALNFLYEAVANLLGNFVNTQIPRATAYTSLNIGLGTWLATRKVVRVGTKSRLIGKGFRQFCTDFGPTVVIIAMSAFSATPFVKGQKIDYLNVASKFELAGGRGWFPDLLSVPVQMRFMCVLPAILLSMLFYLDQNITVRTTEASLNVKPSRKGGDKKGYYHQDMLVLALITGGLSVVGLPWVCGATVQSLNHVRACSGSSWIETRQVPMVAGEILEEEDGVGGVVKSTKILADDEVSDGSNSNNGGELSFTHPLILEGTRVMRALEERKYVDIMESRVTGFTIHAMILSSLLRLPLLSFIPIPVISGIFLYLGLKIMKGNLFFERLGDIMLEESRFKAMPPYRNLNRGTLGRYLATQAIALAVIWLLKSNKKYSIFFPACIGVLAFMRRYVLPRFFAYSELKLLDPLN